MPVIREIEVVNHRLDPTETILHVRIPGHIPGQIIGRLNGPRCPFSTTVEIAYPLRERERGEIATLSAVIPEPSWWDPESPFVYHGFIELPHGDAKPERTTFQHAIYWLQMTSKGLRLNGRPFQLRGKCVDQIGSLDSLRDYRSRGFNWLILPESPAIEMRNLCMTHGFFVSHESALTDQPADVIDHDLDIVQDSARQNRRAANNEQTDWFTAARPFRIVRDTKMETIDGFTLMVMNRIPAILPSDQSIIGWIEV